MADDAAAPTKKAGKKAAKKKVVRQKGGISKAEATRTMWRKMGKGAANKDVEVAIKAEFGLDVPSATVSIQKGEVFGGGSKGTKKKGKPGRKPGKKIAAKVRTAGGSVVGNGSPLEAAVGLIEAAGGIEAAQAALSQVASIAQRLNKPPF